MRQVTLRPIASLLIGSLLLLGGCAAPLATLEGRVLHDGEPVAGATISLTPEDPGAATLSATTDEEGEYVIPGVEPGGHSLGARLEGETPLVSARRETPLHLAPGEERRAGLKLVPWEGAVYSPEDSAIEGFGTLSGVVLHRGNPVEGAVINLYLDREEGLKGPGVRQSFPSDAEGTFFIGELSEGRYYAVARKRLTGAAGPVREGDLHGEAAASPLLVRSGSETSVTIHLVKKEKTQAPHSSALEATATAIKGKVVDDSGKSVAGVYVFAYRERIIGHKMPEFLTPTTGADGKFTLPLGEGGLFYVGAREYFGGSPRPGEKFGQYDGSPDHGIRVKEGEVIEGVTIRVNEVLSQ